MVKSIIVGFDAARFHTIINTIFPFVSVESLILTMTARSGMLFAKSNP
jgi:hypothetical protein